MRALTPRLILTASLIAVALASWSVVLEAQRLPPGTRVRVTTTDGGDTTTFVGAVIAAEGDTLRLHDARNRQRLFPVTSIVNLERSDGARAHSLGRRALTVVGGGAIGAAVGWLSWHACEDSDDPEDFDLVSCLIAPGGLGTAVRVGAWAGTGVGLLATLLRGRSEAWTQVPIASNGLLSIVPAANGARLGVTFTF